MMLKCDFFLAFSESQKVTLQVRQNSDGVIRLVRSNQIGDTGYGLWYHRIQPSHRDRPDDPQDASQVFAPGG